MRLYIRFCRTKYDTKTDYFMTFRPSVSGITINRRFNSDIINNLITQNLSNDRMGYGIGFYDNKIKYWFAPYGNQPEFMHTLNSGTYNPFLDIKDFKSNNEYPILHYIGYYPSHNYHQLYYFLGKDTMTFNKSLPGIDNKKSFKNADYYGLSETFDQNNHIIKQNFYAMRIPTEDCLDLIKKEFPMINISQYNPRYVNFSYRNIPHDTTNEMTLNFLIH